MYDYFGRSRERVVADLHDMEVAFAGFKSQIIRNANDWEVNAVKDLIGKIETFDYVGKYHKYIIVSDYEDGLICDRAYKNLIELLSLQQAICKDRTTLEENKKPE